MKVLSNSIYYIATATYNVTMTNLRAGSDRRQDLIEWRKLHKNNLLLESSQIMPSNNYEFMVESFHINWSFEIETFEIKSFDLKYDLIEILKSTALDCHN